MSNVLCKLPRVIRCWRLGEPNNPLMCVGLLNLTNHRHEIGQLQAFLCCRTSFKGEWFEGSSIQPWRLTKMLPDRSK